jgi:hypothetical protein
MIAVYGTGQPDLAASAPPLVGRYPTKVSRSLLGPYRNGWSAPRYLAVILIVVFALDGAETPCNQPQARIGA